MHGEYKEKHFFFVFLLNLLCVFTYNIYVNKKKKKYCICEKSVLYTGYFSNWRQETKLVFYALLDCIARKAEKEFKIKLMTKLLNELYIGSYASKFD